MKRKTVKIKGKYLRSLTFVEKFSVKNPKTKL